MGIGEGQGRRGAGATAVEVDERSEFDKIEQQKRVVGRETLEDTEHLKSLRWRWR